jgi:hypothetical protein
MENHITRNITKREIKNGFISVPTKCQDCGDEEPLDCHHNNYDDPYDVVFLCKVCHAKRHHDKNRVRIKNGISCTCKRCNYKWVSHVTEPKQCPYCKSPCWRKEKRGK